MSMSKKWAGCWGGLPCFGSQKGGKRIVPATRAPVNSTTSNQSNGTQATGLPNQTTSIPPHLLAPPSSPASFSNSALPSTAQSPRCHLSLSAASPGGPTSTMFVTGPYAHETQLVTPPVFSTFTTEPSTAPFTPPPELAHLTTPSSPDVPFAHFLSSSGADLNNVGNVNYTPLSPGSPVSALRSPVSRTSGDSLCFPDKELPSPWDGSPSPRTTKHPRNGSGRNSDNGGKSQASNFFCPATFAQFYLDQPHSVGRLSISKESDSGTVNQSKPTKSSKQEVEELEAYRASFGFSADEMITTSHYVEISDVTDVSFSMVPCSSDKSQVEETTLIEWGRVGSRKFEHSLPGERSARSGSHLNGKGRHTVISPKQDESNNMMTDDEDIFRNMGKSKKSNMGHSCSDAEIEYRRGRSLRECRGDLTWL